MALEKGTQYHLNVEFAWSHFEATSKSFGWLSLRNEGKNKVVSRGCGKFNMDLCIPSVPSIDRSVSDV